MLSSLEGGRQAPAGTRTDRRGEAEEQEPPAFVQLPLLVKVVSWHDGGTRTEVALLPADASSGPGPVSHFP